mgnify:CR=1 FL=1
MAVHNFNYTFTYKSCKTTPKSFSDNTQIVREITCTIAAVDQADSSQTLTVDITNAIPYHALQDADSLPDSFIPVASITEAQMVTWLRQAMGTTDASEMDGYFTWQLYGPEEVDTNTGD